MKLKQAHNNSRSKRGFAQPEHGKRRRILRRFRRRHDPMLVLNMTLFNFTDGWNRAFSREQYARFSV
jgi:hypothetical protein